MPYLHQKYGLFGNDTTDKQQLKNNTPSRVLPYKLLLIVILF